MVLQALSIATFFSPLITTFQKFKHEQVEDVREFSLKSSGKY